MISFADRAVARQHLELAERRVAEGQQRITTQLALVARLERHGHDIREAVILLRQLEAILALQVQARDCLRELNYRIHVVQLLQSHVKRVKGWHHG
jgi:hypothetical protein